MTGVRVVKAFARQQYEINKFENDNWEKYQRGKKLLLMHSFFWPSSDILCGAQILVGYFIGASMAINGTISVGTYLAYVGLVVWIIWPMRNLGRLIVQMSQGMVSYTRVRQIIKEDREPLDLGDYTPLGDLKGHLVFENVHFYYEDDEETVLEEISFECEPGQVIALLGSTGSGKTTLVNLLPRFYGYTGGRILLDSIALTAIRANSCARKLGWSSKNRSYFRAVFGRTSLTALGAWSQTKRLKPPLGLLPSMM